MFTYQGRTTITNEQTTSVMMLVVDRKRRFLFQKSHQGPVKTGCGATLLLEGFRALHLTGMDIFSLILRKMPNKDPKNNRKYHLWQY